MSRLELSKEALHLLYVEQKKSVADIARLYKCSEQKINYWLKKSNIAKRSISESLYIKHNPDGDPFSFSKPNTLDGSFLFGLGLGLYWGEGNKKNSHSVRLGNTDPRLVKKFIEFLEMIYSVRKEKFRFGLQVFSDMSPQKALRFWCRKLGVSPKQFGKVIVTSPRGLGTYREKTKHGVVTVYVSNKKLRDLLVGEVEKL